MSNHTSSKLAFGRAERAVRIFSSNPEDSDEMYMYLKLAVALTGLVAQPYFLNSVLEVANALNQLLPGDYGNASDRSMCLH